MTPEKGETCAMCKRPRPERSSGWQRSLVGLVCPNCWRSLHPESAEYWQRWETGAAKERKRAARKRYKTPPMEVG